MTRLDAPIDAARFDDEWLEADGFGGFASGTVGLARTRRYHALLLCAARPPGGRMVLVNGIEAWIETDNARYPLTMQRYAPDVLHPDVRANLRVFDTTRWPTWRFEWDGFGTVQFEVCVAKETRETVLRWRFENSANVTPPRPCTLRVRPLLSGRDYHATHHQNDAFNFDARIDASAPGETRVTWQPYADVPAIEASANGAYEAAPDWYRDFLYAREQERGLDCIEDLATPGVFSFDLSQGEAAIILRARLDGDSDSENEHSTLARAASIDATETARRAAFTSRLARSADAYVVERNTGRTILAGFPWFTDWGRDTFIAMRGLLIASGRLDDARAMLLEWSGTLSEGMLPNRFPDYGDAPEYNSVDASLWFVIAVHDYLATGHADASTALPLQRAVDAILDGYTAGTRFGIRADSDGLLACGVPGVQLTWMDAKYGDHVVTPRIGKPVEVQTLWCNALVIASAWDERWRGQADRACAAFRTRFVVPETLTLYDNIDVDHVTGHVDRAVRPNQIFALGGLPFTLIDGDVARAVLAQVEAQLLTPMGLRTLAPDDPAYCGRYAGGPQARDSAYHQGTVWPWLLGPFVEAWLRVQRGLASAASHPDAATDTALREEAHARFVAPLLAHLDRAGLDHLSEVADGDAPHTPGGTPFQAWSLGELLRIERLLRADCAP